MTESRGVIFVAFGDRHPDLAARAAESVRRVAPTLAIDLFADRDMPGGPFDQVHRLTDVWVRSKLDGMLASRFDRTIYLDADVRAVSDFTDAFDLLDRFDLAFAHDQYRNWVTSRKEFRRGFPNAFPHLNGGVCAFRKTPGVEAFLTEWKVQVLEQGIGKDQPALRELIWDTALRIAVLPAEYNLWDFPMMDRMHKFHTAPRIIHSNVFVRKGPSGAPGGSPADLRHFLGRSRAARLESLIAADHTLARLGGREVCPARLADRVRIRALMLADLPGKIAAQLRR